MLLLFAISTKNPSLLYLLLCGLLKKPWFDWRAGLSNDTFPHPGKVQSTLLVVGLPHATLQSCFFMLNSTLCFNPTSPFLGVIFDRTLFFSNHVSSLVAKFFFVSKPYSVSWSFAMLPHRAPFWRASLSFIESFSLVCSHQFFTRKASFFLRYLFSSSC